MVTRLANATRSAMIAGIGARADAGPGPGTVQIRTGGQPASAESAATGTLLGTLTLADPAFGAPVNGVATANAVTGDPSGDAAGEAGWYRVLDSTGATVMDGSISTAGNGGDMIVASTAVYVGSAISITSWTVTQPAG